MFKITTLRERIKALRETVDKDKACLDYLDKDVWHNKNGTKVSPREIFDIFDRLDLNIVTFDVLNNLHEYFFWKIIAPCVICNAKADKAAKFNNGEFDEYLCENCVKEMYNKLND